MLRLCNLTCKFCLVCCFFCALFLKGTHQWTFCFVHASLLCLVQALPCPTLTPWVHTDTPHLVEGVMPAVTTTVR